MKIEKSALLDAELTKAAGGMGNVAIRGQVEAGRNVRAEDLSEKRQTEEISGKSTEVTTNIQFKKGLF